VSVTTQELIERAEERTGLARNQLLLMVAKSAAVRHHAKGRAQLKACSSPADLYVRFGIGSVISAHGTI